jgi:DNA-binding transcriptional LysR family regulator
MTLHQLKLFAAIARHRSVTKAAQILRTSQPSVSQQVGLLENEIGKVLFKNNGHGIELTEAGYELLKRVEPILSQLEELKKDYSAKSCENQELDLVLAGSTGPVASVLPSLIRRFKQGHPEIRVSLRTGTSAEIEELVATYEVAIGVITNPATSGIIHIEPFRTELLSVFVRANHPLAKRTRIDAVELARLPLVVKGEGNPRSRTEKLLNGLREKGLKPNIYMRCESTDSVKSAVREDQLVGILYKDLVEPAVKLGVFKLLKLTGVSLTGQSYIVYSNEKPLSPSAREFLDLLHATQKTALR